MPGRSFNSNFYRYGHNTQEKVDEISGSGNHYTAMYWQYDPRLVRRWNQDPVNKPGISPYLAFGNNPILYVDPNGDDWFSINGKFVWKDQRGDYTDNTGTTYQSLGASLKVVTTSQIESDVEWPWLADPGDHTGVKLETQITITGNYNEEGEFTNFTASIKNVPHSSFEGPDGKNFDKRFVGESQADGIPNVPSSSTGSFGKGTDFNVTRSTQAPDRNIKIGFGIGINPARYLKRFGGNNPLVIQSLTFNVAQKTGELTIKYSHGATPSLHSTVGGESFYNFKSHSYSIYEFPKLDGFRASFYERYTREPQQQIYEQENRGTNESGY